MVRRVLGAVYGGSNGWWGCFSSYLVEKKEGDFLSSDRFQIKSDKVGDGVRVQLFSRDLDQRNIAGGQWAVFLEGKERFFERDVGSSLALERGNLRGPSDPLLAESEFFGSSDHLLAESEFFGSLDSPMVNWNIKKRNKDGCFIGRELVRNLAVTSSSISKKRRSISSNLMRIHNMKTRSISVGETGLHHKLEEKEVWNLDDEIVKVFERDLALGLDFNGRKKEISKLIAGRDVKNDNRFRVLVKTLVAKHRSIVS
ncbi:hypothetical protein LWI29_015146 [Acer saccharum]|uniref:Uncharacterized protein n=1 Tax=Acer saccharum TaxID=4024 RepID=A0AA39V7R8_ACESA|nr:hypothetical protein LWI29_015146 [Acer saccharum]